MKNTFLGKMCRNGHGNPLTGNNYRYKPTGECMECRKIKLEERKDNEAYKEYQRAYFQMLRDKRPEKLAEYRQTQIRRGHSHGRLIDPDPTK